MKILIAGITGLIGKKLALDLNTSHTVFGIGRTKSKILKLTKNAYDWNDNLERIITENQIDVIINLCGASIGQLWLEHYKSKLRNSRFEPTKKIISALEKHPNVHLINASGIGVYGYTKSIHSNIGIESIPAKTPKNFVDKGFLCQLSREWEKYACTHKKTTLLRLAPVFDYYGGIYKKIITPSILKVIIQFGNGEIPFPWISLSDVSSMIELIIQKEMTGAINLCTNEAITFKEIHEKIAAHNRCQRITIPDQYVNLLFGQMGTELFLNGCQAKPDRLIKNGFVFKFPNFYSFLSNTLS